MERSRKSHGARWFAAASLALACLAVGTAASLASGPAATEDADGSLLDSVARVQHVMQQRAAAEVVDAVRQARAQMAAEPDAASTSLKLERERIRLAPELDPAGREQLLGQIDAALAAAVRLSTGHVHRAIQRQELLSEQDARGQTLAEVVRSQRMAEQSVSGASALASQGRYRDAEDVARSIRDPGPASVAASASLLEARMRGNIADVQALAERKRQGVVEAFRAEDARLVPISDDPGIVYPAADKWQMLSERRRKWAEMVSLDQPSPGEEKIYKRAARDDGHQFREHAPGGCDRVSEGEARHRNPARQ